MIIYRYNIGSYHSKFLFNEFTVEKDMTVLTLH